jgi:hypothetical protein
MVPMSNLVISAIRTIVAAAVGAFVTWLIRQGWVVDSAVEQPLTEALVVIITGGYYVIVRAIEQVYPQAGWLLGVPKAPTYPASSQSGTVTPPKKLIP